MSDKPIFRGGRVVLKSRVLPDGSVLLFKPFVITPDRVMRLTDAPGWDRALVDSVFTEGVTGKLRYFQDDVRYDISIEDFRKHAFIRMDDGEQFHVHRKYYKSSGVVSPKRESSGNSPHIPAPTKVTFGEWVPCTRCKASGVEPGKKSERCSKCQGSGYQKWAGNSEPS